MGNIKMLKVVVKVAVLMIWLAAVEGLTEDLRIHIPLHPHAVPKDYTGPSCVNVPGPCDYCTMTISSIYLLRTEPPTLVSFTEEMSNNTISITYCQCNQPCGFQKRCTSQTALVTRSALFPPSQGTVMCSTYGVCQPLDCTLNWCRVSVTLRVPIDCACRYRYIKVSPVRPIDRKQG